mmetsp:Transcript_94389/g.293563  ORF Transcript_94389/g.293563 Transcript_94389/m.293563 type:complete len:230 (+) Transcript_94389:458-1147(+)
MPIHGHGRAPLLVILGQGLEQAHGTRVHEVEHAVHLTGRPEHRVVALHGLLAAILPWTSDPSSCGEENLHERLESVVILGLDHVVHEGIVEAHPALLDGVQVTPGKVLHGHHGLLQVRQHALLSEDDAARLELLVEGLRQATPEHAHLVLLGITHEACQGLGGRGIHPVQRFAVKDHDAQAPVAGNVPLLLGRNDAQHVSSQGLGRCKEDKALEAHDQEPALGDVTDVP